MYKDLCLPKSMMGMQDDKSNIIMKRSHPLIIG